MIYFDNAATSRFKPQTVLDALIAECAHSANAGRSGHNDSIACGMKIFNARNNIKSYIGADDEYEVVFTANASEALNLAIFGYLTNISAKSHVVTSVLEHNSVLRPLKRLEDLGQINTTYLKPDLSGDITPKLVLEALQQNTKMIILNHTSNVTGSTCDVAEIGKIAKSRNIIFLVDGAQSLGHTPLDMVNCNIDMLAGAGHKGLHGAQGVGFLALKRSLNLKPLKYGGTGTNSESPYQPTELPESLECGTLNACGISALNQGVLWTKENATNLHRIYRYLSSELHYSLKQMKNLEMYSKYPSAVISFNIKDYNSTDIANYLNEQGFEIRSGLHCAPLIHKHLGTLERGACRISLGYNNTLSDVRNLVKAIDGIK